jgi:ribulose-5-phosphate 4-epimerase/fuculose-1-phosphate aldolase
MRTAIALAIVLPILSGLPAWAQIDVPGDDSQPAASNIAGQPYPRIHADLRATFRLKAPEAQKVRVHVDKDHDLQRDNEGVWSVTADPLFPGFHYYWFIVDGVNVCDPAGETHDRSVALESFEPAPSTNNEQELRRQLRVFLQRGCRQRLLISTEGSFSARLGEDSFLITPTQQDREVLDLSDFVLVQGNRREVGKKASRAVFSHQAVYRKHPHVQAIVFAHPVNATAFSVTTSTFDTRTIPESYVFLRDVQRVPYGAQYKQDGSIADFVSASSPAAILENDGVLITGSSVLDAFDRLEVLESTAEALINAHAIGKVSAMPDAVIRDLREAFGLR